MKLYLKSSRRSDLSFIAFKEVLGLSENSYQSQSLTFQDGKIYGVEFISMLSDRRRGEVHDLLLLLVEGDIPLARWKLLGTRIKDYLLTDVQLTEEYLELKHLLVEVEQVFELTGNAFSVN